MATQKFFRAPSSSDGEYLLTLSILNGRARLKCECQAAEAMLMCKHRLALLRGDRDKLCGDLTALSDTLGIPEVIALRADCDFAYAKIEALDAEKSRIAEEQKTLKKDLAWRVTTGEWKQ